MRFNTYINLNEHVHKSTEHKAVVFSFDPFRVPTRSHKRMVERTIQEAFHRDAEHMVIVRKATSDKRYKIVCSLIESVYPNANVVRQSSSGNVMEALFMLQESGFTDVTMVTDKNTREWVQEHWSEMASKMFDEFNVISYGDDTTEITRLQESAVSAANALEFGKFSAATGIKDEMLDIAIQYVRETN